MVALFVFVCVVLVVLFLLGVLSLFVGLFCLWFSVCSTWVLRLGCLCFALRYVCGFWINLLFVYVFMFGLVSCCIVCYFGWVGLYCCGWLFVWVGICVVTYGFVYDNCLLVVD